MFDQLTDVHAPDPYCPTCRCYFYHPLGQKTCPPYAVMHMGENLHLHPVTRVEMEVLPATLALGVEVEN